MTDYETTIAQLDAEFEELQFERFGFEDAWRIGQDLVASGRRDALRIAIDISVNGQTLFHAALPGSSPDNDQWIARKNRVVGRFHRSSYYLATALKQKGKSIEEVYGLSKAEYAASGGAVPIRIRGVGVVGTATVSGLADHEDHRMVVEALRRHLATLAPGA
jgi:uncharacterized protein (UPF0303 family)